MTAPGASKPAVQQAIAKILPPGVQVVTGQTVVNESTNSVDQALGFFNTALLVFAFISLFVGGFTIFNTFSIIVGQRTRELALLRIVGANRRQVFRSVLGEAVITGLVSSVIGLGLGVLAALGLEALLRGFGITLPPGSLVFEPRTAIVGLLVGVGVTVVAALGPARGAVRIPPVAALDDRRSGPAASLRRRFIAGTALALVAAMSVFGASVSRSATSSADQAVNADLIVTPTGSGQLSNSATSLASGVPGVTATNTIYGGQFEFQNTLSSLAAVSTNNLASTVNLRMTSGTSAALAQGELLIDSNTAQNKHLAVGDTVPARFALTGPATLRIGGIYQAALLGLVAASWPARRAAKLDVLAAIAAQ